MKMKLSILALKWRMNPLGWLVALFCVSVIVAPTFGNTPIGLADGTTYLSRLPVVYIDFDGSSSSIKKESYHDAHMLIVGNELYGGSGAIMYDGLISIKGRGNTTWKLPKKPYKIKLDKKEDLFGFGKNKHWVLLANYWDESLMRNKIAYDLSGQLGMVQMKSTWVDVVMNGRYIGNYQFCEHIRVGSSRIDIFDWEDVIGDADEKKLDWLTKEGPRDITGGYIFELSAEYDEVSKFKTATGLKVMLKTPEYLKSNKKMFSYVKDFWQNLENAWLSPDKHNGFGRNWTEYADVDSMVHFWLVQEIMGNTDAVYKSRYAYKDIGSPIVFGPVWDFDWSSASSKIGTSAIGWKFTLNHMADNFCKYWLADAEFREKAVRAYSNLRGYLENMVSNGGILDSCRSYLIDSARQNESIWFYKRGFDDDFTMLKNYLLARIRWLDGVLSSESSLERSASPLYGTTLTPTGPFKAANSEAFVGKVLYLGRLVGIINLKSTRAVNGYSRVKGSFVVQDGRKRSVMAKKVPVSNTPALAVLSAKLPNGNGTLAMRMSDEAFLGMLGAYGVEGIRAGEQLSDGDYIFSMGQFPQEVDGYRFASEPISFENKVSVKRGRWIVGKKTLNGDPTTLKLTYKKADSTFSGKLKVNAFKDGRKKVFTVSVVGYISNGEARGVAIIGELGVSCEVFLQMRY